MAKKYELPKGTPFILHLEKAVVEGKGFNFSDETENVKLDKATCIEIYEFYNSLAPKAKAKFNDFSATKSIAVVKAFNAEDVPTEETPAV